MAKVGLSDDEMDALMAQGAPAPAVAAAGPKGLSDDEMDALMAQPAKPAQKGTAETMMRGVAQGATFGFADEATAGLGALKDYTAGKLHLRGDIGLKDAYNSYIDKIRAEDAKAKSDNPWTYGLSELGGAVGSTVTGPGVALTPVKGASTLANVGRIAAGGAVAGAGTSEAPPTSPEFYKDVGIGAGLNLGMAGAFKLGRPIGGAVGGGVIGAAMTDPNDPNASVTRNALYGAAGGATLGGVLAARGAPKNLAKGTAKVFGHVPEEDFEHYWQNNERLRGTKAPENEALKDEIDSAVSGFEGKAAEAKTRTAAAKAQLDALYAERQKNLAGSATSLSEANDLGHILNQEKQVLGEMSKSADQALDASGAKFQKQHLLELMDQIGAKQGDELISDSAQNAVDRFHATRQRIADAAPDEIDAKRLRSYLRQIRDDIDFDHTAGQFDERLNRMRKEFAAKMSGALKDEVPEYAQYMAEMAKRSQSLEGMSTYFGKPERAIASFERVRKGGNPTSQVPEDILRQHAEVTGNKDLVAKLDSWKQNRELSGRMKEGDLRGELYPAESQTLASAEADEAAAQGAYDKVSRLSPARTQSVVENQGRPTANIEDRRALEALGGERDFVADAKDRGVLRRFDQDRTRGARMAVGGAAIGAGIAHKLGLPAEMGAAAGSGAGLVLDKYSGKLTRQAIDSAASLASTLETQLKQRGIDALLADIDPIIKAAQKGYPASVLTLQLLSQRNPQVAAALKNGEAP